MKYYWIVIEREGHRLEIVKVSYGLAEVWYNDTSQEKKDTFSKVYEGSYQDIRRLLLLRDSKEYEKDKLMEEVFSKMKVIKK